MTTARASRLDLGKMVPLASMSIAVGLAQALAMPFQALFLTTEVGASPVALGIFLLVTPLAGLITSTIIGRVSDARAIRRNIIVAAGIFGSVGSVVFAVVRSYWVLLGVSVTLLAAGSCLLAQSFAYARQSLERGDAIAKAPFVITGLRTLISVAWVGGPPLAALLVDKTGYVGLYVGTAVFYAVASVITLSLPELGSESRIPPDSSHTAEDTRGPSWSRFVLPVLAFTVLQGASALGVNTLPLFVTVTLPGTTADAGLILGLCAALEIPIMLGFGLLAMKIDQHRIVTFGAVVALGYHGIMLLTNAVWQVAVAQVLSAIVISAVMGVGISYFQALAPDRPGFITTLFTNSITAGMMLGGPLLGIAQQFGYRTAYAMSMALTVVGLVLLTLMRAKRNRSMERLEP